jgi:hypothetical protein
MNHLVFIPYRIFNFSMIFCFRGCFSIFPYSGVLASLLLMEAYHFLYLVLLSTISAPKYVLCVLHGVM